MEKQDELMQMGQEMYGVINKYLKLEVPVFNMIAALEFHKYSLLKATEELEKSKHKATVVPANNSILVR